MSFSDQLLEEGEAIWEAQMEHPFVRELAAGTLDEEAFRHWVKQDYRYLLDYARVCAVTATKTDDEATMTRFVDVAHTVLDYEMDLHREFAASYGLDRETLESVRKAPTCLAYTNYLLRTAHEGTLAEISAAIFPCGRGYLDVAEHMADIAPVEHRYTPFIEKYTSEEFHEVVDWMAELVDDCAEASPGEREAMREAFLTSARLELSFWEMARTREEWII